MPMMKAVTLTAPWSLFCVHGLKGWETRGWHTSFRGRLAIHTAKSFPLWAKELCLHNSYFAEALERLGVRYLSRIPLGVVIGAVDLVDCRRINARNAPPYPERAFGDYTPGRWMWKLENPVALPEPVPARGALVLWDFSHPVVDYLNGAGPSPNAPDQRPYQPGPRSPSTGLHPTA